MGVAEHAIQQHLLMLSNLRIGIKAAAGVIEVHLPGAVETGIVRGAQFVDAQGGCISRVFGEEVLVGQGITSGWKI